MKKLGTLYASIVSLLLCSISIAAPPSAPQNVQQAWLGSESLLLWDEVPDATSYNIYRSDNTNTTWALLGSSSVPRFRDPGYQFLPSFYVITSVNADGEGSGSEPSTVSFAEQYVVTHFGPAVWNGTLSPTNAIVQWYTDDVNGSQGLVDWGLNDTNFTSFAMNTNYLPAQSFDLTNLTPLTVYYYRLTSINSNRSGVVYIGWFGTPDTNHPPVAEDFFMLWPAWSNGVSIVLRGHDSNFPPVMALTFRIVSQPTNGTLSEIQSGWMWGEAFVTYTPTPGARGYDHFRYVVNNGTWDSAPALVTITNWVNTPPATTNGWVTTPEDTPLALTLPYFDAEGDPITITVSSEWRGTVTGVPPNLIFTPETNYNGSASFSYNVTDGYEQTWGWFSIDVTPVNDKAILETNGMPPIVTWEDWPVQISIWAFDIDWSWPSELIVVTNAAHGTLLIDYMYVHYRPATNFNGTDSFTLVYREFDGTTSDPQTYFVTVHPQNDEPIGLDQNVTTLEDTAVVITPLGTDIDSDPALFTFQLGFAWQSWPTNGWVEQTGTNFIYHPAPDFYGEDHFRFDVIDDLGYRSWAVPGTIHIQVLPVGEPPVASITAVYAHQDAFVNGFFYVNDLDNDVLICEVLTAPTNGTVTVNGTNFLYTPTAGYQGYDLFTYRAFDGEFYSHVTNVYIWINGPNTPPEAIPQTEATLQDTPFTFFLYMWDNEGDTVTANLVDAPTNGAVTFNGSYATYTPAPGFYGTDSFTYQPFDGVTNGSTATITIIVSQPNQPPVANNSTVSGNEDSTIGVNLSASDPEGNLLTYQILSGPANGVLTGSGASRSYRPNTNFNGSDSITFRVSDGQYNSASATVTITVTAVNDAPVATNTSVLAYEEYPVTFVLGGTDVDNGISTCTFTIITPPTHGALSSGNRVRTYTPVTNYFGPDSFTFQINDGTALSGIATVSITVNPLPDAPVAFPQTVTTPEEVAVPITLSAFDADGDTLTYQIFATPNWGTLSGTAPNLTYTPHSNLNGFDWFNFRVSDGMSNSAVVIVGINITPVNDAPVIHEQTYTFAEDVSIFGTYWASDIDSPYESLNYELISGPSHGTLIPTTYSTVGWTYRPDTNYFGTDTFTYIANDGSLTSAVGQVNVVITPVNDAPVANAQSLSTTEDTARPITLTGSDVDTNTLTYSVVSGPSHGALSGSGANLTYTPAANYFGSDSFVFSVSDGLTNSTATVSIDITAVSDLPAPQNLRRRFYAEQYSWPPANFNMHLWWHAVSGADSYNIYRADGTNAPLTLLVSGVAATNYIDTTSELGHFYTYSVAAVNAGDEGLPATTTARLYGGGEIYPNEENWGMWATHVYVIFSNNLILGGEAQFDWGLTTNYTFSIDNTNLQPGHYINISNLQPETVYFYCIISTDVDGNATVYRDSFVTAAAPFGDPQNISVNEDTFVDITLTGQDPGHWGWLSVLTYSVVGGVSQGTLVAVDSDTYRYTPGTNFNGSDSFTFKVNNGELDGPPATVSITVDAVNDLPEAANISFTTAEDMLATIPASFTDVDNSLAYAQIVGEPVHGSAAVSGTNLLYQPATNYFGTDSFTYSISDAYGFGGTATVFLTVTNVDDSPVAFAQSVTAAEDANKVITLAGVDPDGDTIAFSIFTAPSHGTLTGTAPNVTYRAATNYNGSDSFSFRTYDGKSFSAPATVSVTVTPVNDAPIASNIVITVSEDITIMIPPASFDVEGDIASIVPPVQLVSLPAHGTAWSDGLNMFYRPATNYNGSDSFTYHVTDNFAFGNTATVSISVTAVNDAPIVNAQSLTLAEDTTRNVVLTGTDVEGTALSYSIVSGPTNGALSGTAPNVVYTPSANFNGSDSIVFSVSDGSLSSTNIVGLTVTPVNDPPSVLGFGTTTPEDVPLTYTVTASDADNDALTFIIVSGPSHGTVSNSGPTFVYTPDLNYVGSDYFIFRANDGTANSAQAYGNVTMVAVNDAPVANAQTVPVNEDTPATIVLTGSDVEGDTISFTVLSAPAHGTLSGTPVFLTGTNPVFGYTPAPNYHGPDSFIFRVNSAGMFGTVATVTIDVSAVNDAPTVAGQSRSLPEDGSLAITLTGSDIEGDALSFSIVTPPTHGALSGTGANLTYTPEPNYNGADSFTFVANDGTTDSALATVSLTVTTVNDAPVAAPQSQSLAEDGSLAVTLAGSDIDGDALTFSIVTPPAHGALSGTGANLTYTPEPNYNGADSFTFVANDGAANSAPATVNLTVTPVNDAPVAAPQSQSLPEDGSLALTLAGSDIDGDVLGFSIVTPPAHGALSGTGANLTYTPEPNYNGADSFTFVANDGTTNSVATVSLTITAVNDAPVASNASRTLAEDAPAALTLTASDVDGDALTFSIVEMPTHGTLSGTGANITYTPAANYNGSDSFIYRATDPSGASSDALFSLTITPANDLPVGTDQTVEVTEETPSWFVPTATDVDGDAIGFVITEPLHGTAVVTNGGILYTPNTDYFGNDILYYWPSDAISTGALTVVVFNITNVNDAPTANGGSTTTAEDTAASITLSSGDADSDALTFVIVSGPSHGELSGTDANRTYTPAANYNGADSFTFRVDDGTTNSAVATVSLTISPVNDAPTVIGYGGVTGEDTPLAFTLTASDVESNALTYIIVSNPSHGTLSGSGPAFTYTPSPNYNGPDSFSFKVNDGLADSGTALANLTVTAVNDAPVANAQPVSAAEDLLVPITLTGSDIEGTALTYTVIAFPAHGTLTGTAPNLTYRSATNYNGADSFTFRVNDGSLNSANAMVSIDVTAVNDAPVANPQSVTVTYNTAKAITLSGSDLEGSALTYSIVSGPTNGTVSGTAPNVTYTPTVGSAGADNFTFRVNDGGSNSAPVTVNITTLSPVAISPAPSSLNVTVPTALGTLILNWSCTATNEDGFKIERSLSSGSGWSQIATTGINTHTFTNTGLTSGTRYYYRVRSYNRLGNSAYSNTVNAKPR